MASSQPNISSRMCRGFFLSCRDSLNRSRATHNKNCRRDLFLACFHASDPSWTPGSPGLQPGLRLGLGFQYILNVVFPASIRSTVHRRGSGVSTDISRSCCSTGAGSPYFLSRPVPSPLQIQFSHSYACVNLQTFATSRIVLHLLANPGSTLFRVRFCSLPMNNNVIKRCTIDRHTILSQVCPRDVAPTWRQRQMDKLRSCDLNILCGVGSSFGDIPRKTTKSIPTVDIPSVSNIHLSNPWSFHESICRHDENAAGSCVVPKRPTNIQLWLHSTTFPACASRENFTVRVCLFTSRMADSATPFVACSPTGLSRKTNSMPAVSQS